MCGSLLLAGRSIISIRRSICGRSGVPFLQGRLLLQQVCHAAQADAKKTAPEELCQIDTIPPTIEKTERSQRGTPCCTYRYRIWILAGCVRRAHPVFVFMETHAVPYATSGSFLRTPSAVVSYKICPANLARTSKFCVPSELFHLPSSSSFNTSCPAQTSGNQ